jgi:hypothetical protein
MGGGNFGLIVGHRRRSAVAGPVGGLLVAGGGQTVVGL